MKQTTIKGEFADLDNDRAEFLSHLRDCAAFTIPSILPPASVTGTNKRLPEAFQSLGARGVKNIQGRLITTLFPIGTPWFSLRLPPHLEFGAGRDVPDETVDAVNEGIAATELVVQSQIDRTNYRRAFRMTIEQAVVLGNWCYQVLDKPADGMPQVQQPYNVRVFRFDNYVVKRGDDGDMLKLIIRERMDPLAMTEELANKAKLNLSELIEKDAGQEMYTRCLKQLDSSWVIEQEMNGEIVTKSQEKVLPYQAGRYDELPGEHYGRSLVSMLIGDLRSHNGLSRAILEMAGASSRLLIGVDPGGHVMLRDITKAKNGVPFPARIRNGIIQDVAMLHANLGGDFAVAKDQDRFIAENLAKAMMMESAVQPRGERVTATQVMRIADELDGQLGAVYSTCSEMQVTFLERTIWQMRRDNLIPTKAEELIDTTLVTGLEAIRRAQDLQKLNLVMELISKNPAIAARIDEEAVIMRVFSLTGIDPTPFFKTDEELEAERQAEAQARLAEEAGRKAIEVTGNVAEQQQQAPQQAPPQAPQPLPI